MVQPYINVILEDFRIIQTRVTGTRPTKGYNCIMYHVYILYTVVYILYPAYNIQYTVYIRYTDRTVHLYDRATISE